MKIRQGFVSNSSSSSFILDPNKHTCVSIAIQMINVLKSESYDNSRYMKMIENLNKLDNKYASIFVKCCDDIEIAKIGDKIYVQGSNHFTWNLDSKCYEEGEFHDKFQSVNDWYLPEYDNKFLGRQPDWDYNYPYKNKEIYRCADCRTIYLEIKSGELMCPSCLKDPDGKKISIIQREDKLKRLLKDEN